MDNFMRIRVLCSFIAVFLLLFLSMSSRAQEATLLGRVYVTGGQNYSEGIYGSVAALVDWRAAEGLVLTAGAEGFRAKGFALTGGWRCRTAWAGGRLSLFGRYLWRRLERWNIDECSAHTGLSWRSTHWLASLGVANRFMRPVRAYDMDHGQAWVFEPFNILYELQYTLPLGRAERWALALRVADFDWFLTDRAYQPLFSMAVSRTLGHGLTAAARAVCQPTGMLSLSANYYHVFVNLGIEKQW